MAKARKKVATLTREELEDQVDLFLRQGGKIEKVPTGVTGIQTTRGPRHITITPSRR